jgi:hypothetical protein
MANYFNYTGLGGLYAGTNLPNANGTIDSLTEKVIAITPFQDNRVAPQGGVLVAADVIFATSTAPVGTFYCRQATLGTAAVTGSRLIMGGNVGTGTYIASIGTFVSTISGIGESGIPHFRFTWVDQTGTFPIPSYCLTGTMPGGTATIAFASITATPLGA